MTIGSLRPEVVKQSRPSASSPAALQRMKTQRRANTKPEFALRQFLHGRGWRYRIERSVLPGSRRHDIVFGRHRVVVEVRGCFWHACETHGTAPKANNEWWAAKLDRNRARDRETADALADAGWRLIVVWEHEGPETAGLEIESVLRSIDGNSATVAGKRQKSREE